MTITTKTSTGTEVVLTPTDGPYGPTVEVAIKHPTLGELRGSSHVWGNEKGQSGIIVNLKGKRVCVTVPKSDFDVAMKAAREIGERELAEIRSGARMIELRYQQGSPLSGHTTSARAGRLLMELGLAREIDGWGLHVQAKVAKTLGERFTYAQAVELSRPAREAQEAAEQSRQAKIAALAEEAGRTGQRQVLGRGFDGEVLVTRFVDADGRVTSEGVNME